MAVTSRALVSEGAPAWKTDQSMGRTAESAGAGGFVTGGYTRRKKAVGTAGSMETLSRFVAVEPDTANQFVLRPTFNELVCSCNCQPVQPAGQLTRNSPSASTPAVRPGGGEITNSMLRLPGLFRTLALIPGASGASAKALKSLLS